MILYNKKDFGKYITVRKVHRQFTSDPCSQSSKLAYLSVSTKVSKEAKYWDNALSLCRLQKSSMSINVNNKINCYIISSHVLLLIF